MGMPDMANPVFYTLILVLAISWLFWSWCGAQELDAAAESGSDRRGHL
jgi:hypothetical protein